MKLKNWIVGGLSVLFVTVLYGSTGTAVTSCSSGDIASSDAGSCNEVWLGYTQHEFDRYDVNPTMVTPEGTPFDPSGQNISGELIDRLTNEVQACLAKNFPDGVIPDGFAQVSYCEKGTHINLPIDKKSFVVKIAGDWVLNCDGTQQVLPKPVESGNVGCWNKGELPTAQCPCRWRAGIACPNKLITCPNFYLYKDVLIRFSTGCAEPWQIPQFAECASPSTTPLSDGSDPNNGTPQPIQDF